MGYIQFSCSVFDKVIDEDISFSTALKMTLGKSKEGFINKNKVSSICGCALRHYLIFSYHFKEIYAENNPLLRDLSLIYFAEHIFLNADTKEIEKEINNYISNNSIEFDFDYLKQLSKDNIIPDTFKEGTPEFLSLRYNVPEWIVRMWIKHFGDQLTSLTLRALSKKPDCYAQKLVNKDSYEGFENSKFDNLLKLNNKESISKNIELQQRNLFVTTPAIVEMFSKVDLDALRGISFYQECPGNYLLNIVNILGNTAKVDIVSPNPTVVCDIKKAEQDYSLNKVRLFNEQSKSIDLSIPTKSHTFFVFPNSSNFVSLQLLPDYFLHFKQDSLDVITQNQLEALENASINVEDDGELIYAVPTLNKKETKFIISSFVKKHPEFTFREDRQYFPFDRYSSVYYFAILDKKKN